ncbi:MAG: hypothetical protein SFZ03_09000 [Candidatus Melainabacteria bacterium]|nr:hypothetical protein [Candidatus Melainabacteria bacterium]
MARFVYRLQKVYELRERRKKEQEQRVLDAEAQVRNIQAKVQAKKNEMLQVIEHKRTSNHMLMPYHDTFLRKLNDDLNALQIDLSVAEDNLRQEKIKLQKAQQDLEALEKHKEKSKELWMEEQKAVELKMLDEIAGQRYFRSKAAAQLEAQEEAAENWSEESDEDTDLEDVD